MPLPRCILKPAREKSVLARHPWVFSGAIDQIEEGYQAGDLIRVESSSFDFLGLGTISPESQIAIRMLSFQDETVNASFFKKRIEQALEIRKQFLPETDNAYRLIHGEGDGLPGLIVDRYNNTLVCQFHTAGMEKFRKEILQGLQTIPGIQSIYEKSDPEWRKQEGLSSAEGLLAGDSIPNPLIIQENGHQFAIDIQSGQKTGFFLDQRDNRKLVGSVSKGRKVLNCFSYTGGFSVYAAKAGAISTVSVDSSEPALQLAEENFKLNQIPTSDHRFLKTDVFQYLRQVQESFDLIILDPPAFCQSKNQVDQASRGYKDVNLFAFKKIAPGGLVFTASCSSFISADLFQKIIFAAAKDSGRQVQILQKTSHGFDHPVSIYFPEGEYLKGFLLRVS